MLGCGSSQNDGAGERCNTKAFGGHPKIKSKRDGLVVMMLRRGEKDLVRGRINQQVLLGGQKLRKVAYQIRQFILAFDHDRDDEKS